MNRELNISVVGAGVIGLTNAIRLREAGYQVEILARDFSPDTTSDVAAAFWCPYRVAQDERAFTWASKTFETFSRLAALPESGIVPRRQRELFKTPTELPWYFKITQGFERCRADDMPPGFVDGFELDTYLVDTPTYMQYLNKRCEELGIRSRQENLTSLAALLGRCDLAINCSGVWARHLVDDDAVYPIRGQVIVTDLPEGFTKTITTWDNGDYPAYIVPRLNSCILGGTTLVDNWDLNPDPKTADGIRERCANLNPLVLNMPARKDRVGLRPGRNQVRLEKDDSIPGLPVIHCYGHGGSGFTLSWGCAEEVLAKTR